MGNTTPSVTLVKQETETFEQELSSIQSIKDNVISFNVRTLFTLYERNMKSSAEFQQKQVYKSSDKQVVDIVKELAYLFNAELVALVLTECNGNKQDTIIALHHEKYVLKNLQDKYSGKVFSDADYVVSNELLRKKSPIYDLTKNISKTEMKYLETVSENTFLKLNPAVVEEVKEVEYGTETDIDIKKMTNIARERELVEKRMHEEKMSRNTKFYCEGEYLALQLKQCKRYTFQPTNVFDCDAEQIHFRFPESQLFRKMGGNHKVIQVDYIVQPEFIQKFHQCRLDLAKRHGFLPESMKPLLLFHGTSDANMENIIKTNFLRDKIGSTTDMGYYGKGFYFSEHASMSISYSRGNPHLLVCLVFVGKAHKMDQVIVGCAKQEGYDSHVSPDGCSEVIIFEPDQVLPCYKIKYEATTGY
jgi:hypothetical protein